MWCPHCQQDVPTRPASQGGPAECFRCRRPVTLASGAIDDSGMSLEAPRFAFDVTASPLVQIAAADRRVAEVARRLRTPIANPMGGLRELLLDPPHAPTTTIAAASAAPSSPAPTPAARRFQRWAWLAVALGCLASTTGVLLLALELRGGSVNLWNWALVALLGGQSLLVVGLVAVVACLWMSSQSVGRELVQVHRQLGTLEATATTAIAERQASAATFYTALSHGASPHVLLGTLRGQLDQLATRLG